MNSLVAVVVTTIFFTLTGWHSTYILPISSKLERIGLSFLLGAGLSTFFWFIGHLGGLPLNILTLANIGLTVMGIGFFATRKYIIAQAVNTTRTSGEYDKWLAVALILILLIAFLIGSHNALTAWDSIALYDFRGHIIALNHDLRDIVDSSYYVSYPLMISLVHAVVYMLGGTSAQGMHAIFLMAFTGVIYGRMKEWTSQTLALITSLLVITQGQIFYHATFAYTNLPYTVYLVTGLLYAVSAKKKEARYLLIAGILIGLSTWMRFSETFWVIGILLILAQGIVLKRTLVAIISILLLLAIRFSWSTYFHAILVNINYSFDETLSSFGAQNIQQILNNLPEITSYVQENILSPYAGIWFLNIPISLIALTKKDFKLTLLLGTILISLAMVISGIMVFSTYYTTWNQIGDSATRMIMFIVPLTIITAMYALHLVGRTSKAVKEK